jgi:hypothetical protein
VRSLWRFNRLSEPIGRRGRMGSSCVNRKGTAIVLKRLHVRVVLPVLLLVVAAFAGVAYATDGGFYTANLQPVNGNPPAHGSLKMFVAGRQVTVDIHATGLAPNLPHAMHIHGVLGDPNACPPPSADTDNDGLTSLAEGAPFYGPIQVSLTTSGDTSPDSALVLSRFAVADANGNLDYHRTFTIPKEIAQDLTQLHVVLHGADLNANGTYDDLFEATLPVACGTLSK